MFDGFRGTGYGPYRFSTIDFYLLCKQHLAEGGVVVANLLGRDQLYLDKILTFSRAFNHSYLFSNQDVSVLIGTDGPEINKSQIIERATQIQATYRFVFSLSGLAHIRPGTSRHSRKRSRHVPTRPKSNTRE